MTAPELKVFCENIQSVDDIVLPDDAYAKNLIFDFVQAWQHLHRFKTYVHERLDKAEVPVHPTPQAHSGCRIGSRLDWMFGTSHAHYMTGNLLLARASQLLKRAEGAESKLAEAEQTIDKLQADNRGFIAEADKARSDYSVLLTACRHEFGSMGDDDECDFCGHQEAHMIHESQEPAPLQDTDVEPAASDRDPPQVLFFGWFLAISASLLMLGGTAWCLDWLWRHQF